MEKPFIVESLKFQNAQLGPVRFMRIRSGWCSDSWRSPMHAQYTGFKIVNQTLAD